jgi:hypothetical protein
MDANGFDLPIALGLLLGSGQVAFIRPGNFAIVGELALTGESRLVKGILSLALQAVLEGRDGLLVPTANATEAAVVEGLNAYPVGSLPWVPVTPYSPRGRGNYAEIRCLLLVPRFWRLKIWPRFCSRDARKASSASGRPVCSWPRRTFNARADGIDFDAPRGGTS